MDLSALSLFVVAGGHLAAVFIDLYPQTNCRPPASVKYQRELGTWHNALPALFVHFHSYQDSRLRVKCGQGIFGPHIRRESGIAPAGLIHSS